MSNELNCYDDEEGGAPENVKEDVKSRKAVGRFGPWVLFIGTIIWGFADLLNNVFWHVN